MGVLLNNQWSIGGDPLRPAVNTFLAQPFINYKAHGWFLTSSPLITANWLAAPGQQRVVPVAGGVGRIFKLGNQPVSAPLITMPSIQPGHQTGSYAGSFHFCSQRGTLRKARPTGAKRLLNGWLIRTGGKPVMTIHSLTVAAHTPMLDIASTPGVGLFCRSVRVSAYPFIFSASWPDSFQSLRYTHQKWKIASTTDCYWPRLAGSAKRDRPIDVEVAPVARLITPRRSRRSTGKDHSLSTQNWRVPTPCAARNSEASCADGDA
jgi:hypothetical protein